MPDKPLAGLKIVVDAGNGAGGFYAGRFWRRWARMYRRVSFWSRTGIFRITSRIRRTKEAMQSISRRVVESGADFGLILILTLTGHLRSIKMAGEISRNAIVAMAAALIAVEHPGTTVVTDSITSDELTVYLEDCLGLKHLRFKRGYKKRHQQVDCAEQGGYQQPAGD